MYGQNDYDTLLWHLIEEAGEMLPLIQLRTTNTILLPVVKSLVTQYNLCVFLVSYFLSFYVNSFNLVV